MKKADTICNVNEKLLRAITSDDGGYQSPTVLIFLRYSHGRDVSVLVVNYHAGNCLGNDLDLKV